MLIYRLDNDYQIADVKIGMRRTYVKRSISLPLSLIILSLTYSHVNAGLEDASLSSDEWNDLRRFDAIAVARKAMRPEKYSMLEDRRRARSSSSPSSPLPHFSRFIDGNYELIEAGEERRARKLIEEMMILVCPHVQILW